MLGIIEGTSVISLRILDWFVTRYAGQYKIRLANGGETDFFVNISYKSQLRAFKKKYFDPFRRRRKFLYHYDKTDREATVMTTIGQLNFFKWAISNNLVEYIETNLQGLIKIMNKTNREDKQKKKDVKEVKKEVKKEDTDDESDDEEEKSYIKIKAEKKVEQNKMKIVLSFD